MSVGLSSVNTNYSTYLNKSENNVFANFDSNSVMTKENESDSFSFSSQYNQKNAIPKNNGIWNKIKHVITGKDYYTTSTGVKIVTDKHYGAVYETEDGQIYADGLKNAKIKGNRSDNTIVVSSSSVKSIKTGRGDDNIIVENSAIGTIKGGNGNDNIIGINSNIDSIQGENGKDTIITENSSVGELNGNWGKDTIVSRGGSIDNLKTSWRDDVNIFENPLNAGPDDEYAFR